MINKKGYSMSGWLEGVIFILLFITIFTVFIGDFNVLYNKNNQISLTGVNATKSSLINLQQTGSESIKGGEAELRDTSSGLGLKSTWSILKSMFGILLSLLTGGFIEDLIGYMHIDLSIALFFRILYVLSLIAGMIYILVGRKP